MNHENMIMIPQRSRISTSTDMFHVHRIKLWEDISVPSEYQEEIDLIDSAGPDDTIVIDICTDGGVLDTAALFNRALRTTPAHTVAIIGPSCSSAGSVIALSCAEFVIDNTSSLMLHTSSYGFHQSKDVDIYEHANFSRKSLKRLYDSVYTGFLDSEELGDVIKGQPFYFDCEDLEKRLTNLYEYRKAQEADCGCEDCQTEREGDMEQPFWEEDRVFDIYQVPITNHRTVNGKVRMTVEVEPEVFARIRDKTVELVVDTEGEDGE